MATVEQPNQGFSEIKLGQRSPNSKVDPKGQQQLKKKAFTKEKVATNVNLSTAGSIFDAVLRGL